jgi:predicted ribosome quality control (RQC) complex YloA/Tae2 family protein
MKASTMGPIPAYEELMGLLRVVANPALFTEKLNALESLRAEINSRITDVGRLSRIDGLEIDAANAMTVARSRLEASKGEADALVADAKVEAAAIKNEIQAVREALRKQEAAAKKEFETTRAALLGERQAAESMRAEALAATADAQKLLAAATAMREEYEQKLGRLQAAMAR